MELCLKSDFFLITNLFICFIYSFLFWEITLIVNGFLKKKSLLTN